MLNWTQQRGSAMQPALDELADLRIDVFCDWPYLYAGDRDYETHYLQRYGQCPDALLICVHDQDRCIAASTAQPLSAEDLVFQAPFINRGLNVDEYFYFAESVCLSAYRGRGIGREFFQRREAFARSLGYKKFAFCSVLRPQQHPARPENYRPLDEFWRRHQYQPHPDLHAQYAWRDIGADEESVKTLQIWTKEAD